MRFSLCGLIQTRITGLEGSDIEIYLPKLPIEKKTLVQMVFKHRFHTLNSTTQAKTHFENDPSKREKPISCRWFWWVIILVGNFFLLFFW